MDTDMGDSFQDEDPRGSNDNKMRQALNRVRELWKDRGEELEKEGIKELLSKKDTESPPSLPVFMLLVAVLMDALDVFNLTLIAKIFLFPLELMFWAMLYFWFRGKMSGTAWKNTANKSMLKKKWMILVEMFIPGFDIWPGQTIMVLTAHYKHKKIVLLTNESLEILRKYRVV